LTTAAATRQKQTTNKKKNHNNIRNDTPSSDIAFVLQMEAVEAIRNNLVEHSAHFSLNDVTFAPQKLLPRPANLTDAFIEDNMIAANLNAFIENLGRNCPRPHT
jgi:hypothetical protein